MSSLQPVSARVAARASTSEERRSRRFMGSSESFRKRPECPARGKAFVAKVATHASDGAPPAAVRVMNRK